MLIFSANAVGDTHKTTGKVVLFYHSAVRLQPTLIFIISTSDISFESSEK